MRMRIKLLYSFFVVIILFSALEIYSRIIESRRYSTFEWDRNDILGWVPKPGKIIEITPEFEAIYDINKYNMNDKAIEESLEISKIKIMAIGDSHTFAVGVSSDEAWPNALEQILFKGDIRSGTVYNCGVSGYNLGQYLLRIRQMKAILKPHILLIGFCLASDVYDLMPPQKNGFVFGDNVGRVYFDLDKYGNLIEKRELAGKEIEISPYSSMSLLMKIRTTLRHSAFFRRFKRSRFLIWAVFNMGPQISSIWMGPSTALKINLDDESKFRWQLTEALIREISVEAKEDNISVVLVNIPYLPQIYDNIWKGSFGKFPKEYDRWIAGRRLEDICSKSEIYYVDTTPKFVDEARKKKKWFHYKFDAHPTAEGHRIIAETVAEFLKNNRLVY